MATALSLCSLAYVEGLRPKPDLTVSQWADANRILGKGSPEPGPWRTDRVPFLRELMDNLSLYSPVEQTHLMKAAQGGGTEVILNASLYLADMGAGDVLILEPTTNTAKRFAKRRIDPAIQLCASLRSKFVTQKSRDKRNTITLKEFPGGSLRISGANSAAELRSDPIPYLLIDEADAMAADLEGEGDPIELAIQRTAAFSNRKILALSTPTLERLSKINRLYLAGDQRHFYVPCPFCDHGQELIWWAKDRPGGLRWPKGKPEEARYQCERCSKEFEEWRKTDISLRGQYIPHAPGNGGGKIRSYSINALIYPYGWPGSSWVNLAAQWERDHKDPIKRKTFWNLKLGLPYSDPADSKADAATLHSRRESYGPQIPARAAVLTVGADVQGNRIEAELVAWGPDEECWGIEYRVFPGDTSRLVSRDPANPSPWEVFDRWLQQERMSALGIPLSVRAACVDSSAFTQVVTQFCGERIGRHVWAIKGVAGNAPVWSHKSRKSRGKWPPPQILGVDTIKEIVYASLRIVDPGPRFAHFPVSNDYDLHYFDMLTAEIRVPDYSGPIPRFEWRLKRQGQRNESLDARGYAYGAVVGLQQTMAVNLALELEHLQRQHDMHATYEKKQSIQGARPNEKPVSSDLRQLLSPIRSDY